MPPGGAVAAFFSTQGLDPGFSPRGCGGTDVLLFTRAADGLGVDALEVESSSIQSCRRLSVMSMCVRRPSARACPVNPSSMMV